MRSTWLSSLRAVRPSQMTRRQMLVSAAASVGAVGAGIVALEWLAHVNAPATPASYSTAPYVGPESAPGWLLSPANPVLTIDPHSPWTDHGVYDCAVIRQPNGALWMYYSTRGTAPYSIALAIDATGLGDHWQPYGSAPVLQPAPQESLAITGLMRPSLVRGPDGVLRLYYSTVATSGIGWIGMATSTDGVNWTKHGSPVLLPQEPWEHGVLMCPNVLYDASGGRYLMWFSAGNGYEPDAVGAATSHDGVTWTRVSAAPIFAPTSGWEGYKVGSFQVTHVAGWYYAFYNAFQRTPFRSQIGMARSRDGVSHWEHHPQNPILRPGSAHSWNAAMVYKPSALWDATGGRWDVWFNASGIFNSVEQIGHAWSAGIW